MKTQVFAQRNRRLIGTANLCLDLQHAQLLECKRDSPGTQFFGDTFAPKRLVPNHSVGCRNTGTGIGQNRCEADQAVFSPGIYAQMETPTVVKLCNVLTRVVQRPAPGKGTQLRLDDRIIPPTDVFSGDERGRE